MGIPRKGSRSVEVDGKPYTFMVKQGRIPDHHDQPASRLIIQEEAERPGRVLRGWFFHGIEITPALVRGLIAEGRRLGWIPSDRGNAFDLPQDRASGRFHPDDASSYR